MLDALPKEDLQEVYDRTSSRYDKQHGLLTLRADQRGRRLVVEHGVREGDRVLDAGGGTGSTTLLAAQRVRPSGRVVLFDLSEGMLDVAREKIRRAGLLDRVELRAGDIRTRRSDSGPSPRVRFPGVALPAAACSAGMSIRYICPPLGLSRISFAAPWRLRAVKRSAARVTSTRARLCRWSAASSPPSATATRGPFEAIPPARAVSSCGSRSSHRAPCRARSRQRTPPAMPPSPAACSASSDGCGGARVRRAGASRSPIPSSSSRPRTPNRLAHLTPRAERRQGRSGDRNAWPRSLSARSRRAGSRPDGALDVLSRRGSGGGTRCRERRSA